MKIMIAEDDKFLANAYRVKLSKANHEVKLVGDGAEALQMVAEFKPDVILLDLIMPVKDGFAFLEEYAAANESQPIPIIVASNLGQDEDVEKAKQLGAVDFVIKTDMSLDELVKKIEKYGQKTEKSEDEA